MDDKYSKYAKLRDEKGVRDADVARDTNIHPSTFTDWKKGKSSPKADKLRKIADYFGVSVDYIVGTEEKLSDSNVSRIAALSKQLSVDNQRKVMEMIEYLIYQQEKERSMSSGTA